MPRKTRAAAKAAEDAVLADTDAPEDTIVPPSPKRDREPLRSITPTSVDSLDNERVGTEEMTKCKAKKGKKGAAKKKGKKGKAEKAEDQPEIIDENAEELAEDAIEELVEEPVEDPVELLEETPADVEEPVAVAKPSPAEERPASSLGRSSRMTRRQQAKAEAEEALQIAEEDAPEPKAIAGELVLSPPDPSGPTETDVNALSTSLASPQTMEALSPLSQGLPDRTRPEPLSLVASGSTSRRTSQVEDPIEAIDALEDEIDEVAKIMPSLDSPTSPVKPRAPSKTDKAKTLKTATTKAAAERTKLSATTQPSATARVRSLAEPKKPASAATALSRSASTKARPKSIIEPKSKEKEAASTEDGKTADAPGTKRRPISMHFPAPPPPAKSTKPLTTSTFTLPGEAVAAKLKAQRAERLKREEEEAVKRREFKARPVPTIRPKPTEVRQTAASRARQSIIGGPEKENSEGGLKRSATVTGASTSSNRASNIAAKRSSIVGAPTANTAQKRSSVVISKPLNIIKPRTAPASTSASKDGTTSPPASLSRNISASEAAAQRQKGKEVYNRDAVEKKAREKAQKEKDDAIRKARAEAAERGRQASREWAEKQKKLALEKKAKLSAEQSPAPTAGFEGSSVAV